MARVTETLKPLPGVAKINIDFPNRLAHCDVTSGEFDIEGAITSLADAGYDKSTVAAGTN